MKFLHSNREEYFLVFANNMLEFFEALSRDYSRKDQNIFFIQIPKIEAAQNAFEIIKSNAKMYDSK